MATESTAPSPAMVPPTVAALDARTVASGRGVAWWVEAWRLFTPSSGTWLLMAAVLCGLIVLAGAIALIPVLGQLADLAIEILWPVLIGGLMLGCRALDRGNPLLLAHLFAGFSQRTKPLVTAGVIYTVLLVIISVAIAGMMIAIFGVQFVSILTRSTDPSQTGIAFSSAVVAALLGCLFFLLLLLPLMMAMWFAPALIMLGGMSPADAMKASFAGCVRNIVPFLVYSVVGLVLAIVATIPFGLGWFVLGPVMVASIYASYCDIYEDKDNV